MDDAPISTAMLGGCSMEDLWSESVGDWYRVFIGVCGPPEAAALPWVFLTDANGTFAMTVDIVRHLQLGGHLPDMVIIGLGYPAATLRDTIERRARDLTPTPGPMTSDDGAAFHTGGADRFLDTIEHAVLPLLERRLPAPTRRVLYGHSLGGLFALHAWLRDRPQFSDFIVASPSTWWDDHWIDRQLDLVTHHASQRQGNIVVCVGAEESSQGRIAAAAQLPIEFRTPLIRPPRDMAADAEDLAHRLAAAADPSSHVWFQRIPNEHHVSIPPLAISHGLRILFDAPGAAALSAQIDSPTTHSPPHRDATLKAP
ncbi:MAG: alpha/beta hydrolase-fold protein [Ilumatobacteraceae bacterium]